MIQTKGPREIAIVGFGGLLILIICCFFDPIFQIILVVVAVPLLSTLDCCKTIIFDEHGCTISLFCLRKFYPWSALKTIRMLDFSKAVLTEGAYGTSYVYCEGVIFCTRRIKRYPIKMSPDMFGLICAPFRSFYIQFTPTNKYTGSYIPWRDYGKKKELPCYFPVDRELFLSCIEKWGVKVEGVNAPLPPEELEQKKKKR